MDVLNSFFFFYFEDIGFCVIFNGSGVKFESLINCRGRKNISSMAIAKLFVNGK